MSQNIEQLPKGYRVHFERLRSIEYAPGSEASFTKTHKYKLDLDVLGDQKQKFVDSFKDLANIVDSSEKGSLIWFLFRLYELGFVFVDSGQKKNDLALKIFDNFQSKKTQYLSSKIREHGTSFIQNKLQQNEKIEALRQNLVGSSRNSSIAWSIFVKEVFNILDLEKLTFNQNINDFEGWKDQEFTSDDDKNIVWEFYKDIKSSRKYDADFRIKFFYKHFLNLNLSKENIESEKKNLKLDTTTFLLRDRSSTNHGTYQDVVFDMIDFGSQIEEDYKTLMGLGGGNYPALSNLFGKTFKNWQKCKNIQDLEKLFEGNDYISIQQFNDIKNTLLELIQNLSKNVYQSTGSSTVSYNGGLGTFRSQIGGRIASWLSNFENRLESYEKSLTYYLTLDDVNRIDQEFFNEPFSIKSYLNQEGDNKFVFNGFAKGLPPKEELRLDDGDKKDKDGTPKKKKPSVPSFESKNFYLAENLYEFMFKKELDNPIIIEVASENGEKVKIELNNVAQVLVNGNKDILQSFEEDLQLIFNPAFVDEMIEAVVTKKYGTDFNQKVIRYNRAVRNVNEILSQFEWQGLDRNIFSDETIQLFHNKKGNKILAQEKEVKDNELDEKEYKSKIYLNSKYCLKELAKYPHFFGEGKTTVVEEFKNSLSDLLSPKTKSQYLLKADSIVKDILSNSTLRFIKPKVNSQDRSSRLRYHLNSLLRIHSQHSIISKFLLDHVAKYFVKNSDIKEVLIKKKDPIKIFESEFAKSKAPEHKIVQIKEDINLEKFFNGFSQFVENETGYILDQDTNWIKVLSITEKGVSEKSMYHFKLIQKLWAMIFEFTDKKSFNFSLAKDQISQMYPEKSENISHLPQIEAQKIFNTYYISNIKGKLTNLSRQSYMRRFIIQKMSDDNKDKNIAAESVTACWIPRTQDSLSKSARSRLLKKNLKAIAKGVDIDNISDELVLEIKNLMEDKKRLINQKGVKKKDNLEYQAYAQKSYEIKEQLADVIFGDKDFDKETGNKINISELIQIPHQFGVKVKIQDKLSNPARTVQYIEIPKDAKDNKGDDKGDFELRCLDQDASKIIFPIQSKGHQLQFFDKYLRSRAQNDKGYKVEMQGISLILEELTDVEWNLETLQLKEGLEVEHKLYGAIPWKISREGEHGVKTYDTKKGGNFKTNFYMGIDVGEYGIGWAFVPKEKSDKKITEEGIDKIKAIVKRYCENEYKNHSRDGQIIHPEFDIYMMKDKYIISGFQPFARLKKLRDDVDIWREKQATGTFTSSSTKIARFRESLIGEIRNFIHALMFELSRDENGGKSIIVYEDSIDAFETGGNKIKKIYKSIKTSDVRGDNTDADKTVRENIWGLLKKYKSGTIVGATIGSSLTSQTCRKCGRSAAKEVYNYEYEGVRDGKKVKLVRVSSKKVLTKEGVETDIVCHMKNGKDEYLSHEVWNVVKQHQREGSKTGKGGQDRFKCQIVDCGHESNADAQAAINIALKKLIRDEHDAEWIDKNIGSIKTFLKYSTQYKMNLVPTEKLDSWKLSR